MKVKLRDKIIDMKPLSKQSNEICIKYVYQIGLYEIEICKYKDDCDSDVSVITPFYYVYSALIPKDKTTKVSEMLQECLNAIADDIHESIETVNEYTKILESVKKYI